MDMRGRKQYLKTLQEEYVGTKRKEGRGRLLDEAEKRTGLNRKYIIRKLSVKNSFVDFKERHRKKLYTVDLIEPLATTWELFGCPCGLRLKEILKEEVDGLRKKGILKISGEQGVKLKKMSAKTIDTLLRKEKTGVTAGLTGRVAGNPLLYRKIPTKLSGDYDRKLVGYVQADAVEHCGNSAGGEYVNTIACTDVGSYWWEATAVMGKGQQRTLSAINANRARMPFTWIEIHPDNGGNFINRFLWSYAHKTGLEITRSRPYKKNDNCFIEQTNSSNVRRYVGHLRYDTEEELAVLNDIYRALALYKNFFLPVIRLSEKTRNKGHVSRKYETPKTPYRWLLESPLLPGKDKARLEHAHNALDPVKLKNDLDQNIRILFKLNKEKKMSQKPPGFKIASVTSYFTQRPHTRLHF